MSSQAVETSFESASAWVNKQLDFRVAHRPIQRVLRDCTEALEEFMETLPAPPAQEAGSLLMHTVDCNWIPMRPTDRSPSTSKSEDKPGEKKMACVTRGYSVDGHVRPAEVIEESSFENSGSEREHARSQRPKPRHRRTVASLR